MYVLGCGSRNWQDSQSVFDALIWVPEGSVLVHGAQRGADMCFDQEGRKLGLRVRPVPADWASFGRAAGPMRNSGMLNILVNAREEGHEVMAMAFHEDPGLGRGTKDMVGKTTSERITTVVFIRDSLSRIVAHVLRAH